MDTEGPSGMGMCDLEKLVSLRTSCRHVNTERLIWGLVDPFPAEIVLGVPLFHPLEPVVQTGSGTVGGLGGVRSIRG